MPQPTTTVIHQGGYDPGARFDNTTGPSLPVSAYVFPTSLYECFVLNLSNQMCRIEN